MRVAVGHAGGRARHGEGTRLGEYISCCLIDFLHLAQIFDFFGVFDEADRRSTVVFEVMDGLRRR